MRKLSSDSKAKHYTEYAAKRLQNGRDQITLLRSVLEYLDFTDFDNPMRILELGSGRGGFIAAAQQEPLFKAWHFVGADMDMASLLINLKLNEELGNRRHKLVCCYGERLPFNDNQFHIIVSFATLEHVGKLCRQVAFVSESCRCLLPGGIGLFLFPNRFDVTAPEGHVYIRFLGFVPQRWKDGVSHLLQGVPSADIYPPNPISLMNALRKLGNVSFELHSWHEFSTRSPLNKFLARSWIYKMCGPWNVLLAKKRSVDSLV